MSIGLVVLGGFGNGTQAGTIPFLVTRGYSIGEVIVTADSTFGVSAIIQARGQGVTGLISTVGQSTAGSITASFGASSCIQERGKGVSGIIDETGQGVTGLI